MHPLDVLGINVDAGSGEPLVLLAEREAPHRVLPIFVGGAEAVAIALALSDQTPPRPLTHDLLAALLEHLDARVDHVELTEVRSGAFLAELCLLGRHGTVTLDSRPSDAIALALRVDAPLFASDTVLDEAGAVLRFATDDADADADDLDVDDTDPRIDDKVERFRAFLDEIDPTAFGNPDDPDDPDHPDDQDGSP